MNLGFIRFTRIFARYTPSARRVIFFAAHEATNRSADEITPTDILLGLARDPHHAECPFRFLHERHSELASSLSTVWGDDSPSGPVVRKLPLSRSSKRVLACAQAEANRSSSFWIDTNHIQVGLLLEDAEAKAALESIGYSVETTRQAGYEAELRWPSKKPSIRQRMAVYPTIFWVVVGFLLGWLAVNLFFVAKNGFLRS